MDDNVDEFRDGRPTILGDFGSDKSSKSRVVAQQNQPLTISSRVPTVKEVANEILRQLKLAQGPPVKTKPLHPQVGVNQNPP